MTRRAYGLMGVLLVLITMLCAERAYGKDVTMQDIWKPKPDVPTTVVLQDLCSGYRLSRAGDTISILCPTRRGWVTQGRIVGLCAHDMPPLAYYKRDDVRFACAHDPNPYWVEPSGPRRWQVYALPPVKR